MNIGLIIYLIFVYNAGGFMLLLFLCYLNPKTIGDADGLEFLNPVWYHRNIRVNWFGAVIITLILSLICPIASVGYWFYKLCTFGRNV